MGSIREGTNKDKILRAVALGGEYPYLGLSLIQHVSAKKSGVVKSVLEGRDASLSLKRALKQMRNSSLMSLTGKTPYRSIHLLEKGEEELAHLDLELYNHYLSEMVSGTRYGEQSTNYILRRHQQAESSYFMSESGYLYYEQSKPALQTENNHDLFAITAETQLYYGSTEIKALYDIQENRNFNYSRMSGICVNAAGFYAVYNIGMEIPFWSNVAEQRARGSMGRVMEKTFKANSDYAMGKIINKAILLCKEENMPAKILLAQSEYQSEAQTRKRHYRRKFTEISQLGQTYNSGHCIHMVGNGMPRLKLLSIPDYRLKILRLLSGDNAANLAQYASYDHWDKKDSEKIMFSFDGDIVRLRRFISDGLQGEEGLQYVIVTDEESAVWINEYIENLGRINNAALGITVKVITDDVAQIVSAII